MKHTKRFWLALFLLCALLCALCSCGKSAGSYRASDDGYAENGSLGFGTAQEKDTGASAPQAAADRKLIRTFTLRFETKDYDTFLSSMRAALQQNGGYSEKAEQHGAFAALCFLYAARARGKRRCIFDNGASACNAAA